MQRVQTLSHLGLVYVQIPDTNVFFQTDILFILVIRNKKGPQVLAAKPATAFPEVVYISVILRYVFASNCSLNRLHLCLLFFR